MSETETAARQAGELMAIAKFVEEGSSPTVAVPKYDRSALRAGMAHIGVGNFHRVHQATYLDDLLHMRADQSEWGILGIELLDDALAMSRARAFLSQDNLYSFTAFSPEGERESRGERLDG